MLILLLHMNISAYCRPRWSVCHLDGLIVPSNLKTRLHNAARCVTMARRFVSANFISPDKQNISLKASVANPRMNSWECLESLNVDEPTIGCWRSPQRELCRNNCIIGISTHFHFPPSFKHRVQRPQFSPKYKLQYEAELSTEQKDKPTKNKRPNADMMRQMRGDVRSGEGGG